MSRELIDRYADELAGRFVVVTESSVRFSPTWGIGRDSQGQGVTTTKWSGALLSGGETL